MNILLIFPKVGYVQSSEEKDTDLFTKIFGEIVSLTLPQVAASTPSKHNVQIIDENYKKLKFENNVDLVGITCLTMCAPRVYEIADKYRSMGIPVVIGGNHPTALPKEAKRHADAVVIGEAEGIWQELLSDFEKGQMKPFYYSKKNVQNKDIPEPRRDLINRKLSHDGILINRGCPNRCEFCTITSSYDRTVKPIENVLAELSKIKNKVVFIYDSNFTINIDYNKQLLKEFKKFKKRWLASGTINALGKNEDFLKLSREAGMFSWYIGFESISQKSLNEINKKVNQVEGYLSAIKKIKENNMLIVGAFIFGFDSDTADIFKETYETIKDWNIDILEFHVLTPFPGTPLYDRLKKEGRILTEKWGKYNFANVVYQPKNMTKDELYEGTKWIIKQFYSISNIFRRFFRTVKNHKDLSMAYYALRLNFQTRQDYKNLFR